MLDFCVDSQSLRRSTFNRSSISTIHSLGRISIHSNEPNESIRLQPRTSVRFTVENASIRLSQSNRLNQSMRLTRSTRSRQTINQEDEQQMESNF